MRKGSRGLRVLVACAAALCAFAVVCERTDASIIVLSDFSSMEVQAPAAAMDATLDFQVVGTTLTLTISNTTDTTNPLPGDLFDVADTYFNVSGDVTGLSLSSAPAGWSLAPSDWTGPGDTNSTTQANGFGVFDWALLFDRDNFPKANQVNPGESVAFTMAISGTGPFDMADFGPGLFSIDPGGGSAATLSLAAAKFRGVDGGNFKNKSGVGATVPEPATVALLGIGLVTLVGYRRRRIGKTA